MKRTKTHNKSGKWFVAYYIRYNNPQLKYGPFKSYEDIIKDETLMIMTGDIIVRANSDKSIFTIKFQFSPKREWVYLTVPTIYSNCSGNWKILEPKKIDYAKNKTQWNPISPGNEERNSVSTKIPIQKKLF